MYFKEREEFNVFTEIKTLKGWYEFTERTGKGSICDYLNKGDIVDEAIVDYFMNIMPPRALSYRFLQVEKPTTTFTIFLINYNQSI